MVIYIPNLDKANEIGGGNTFLRNFLQGIAKRNMVITETLNSKADIAFFWAPHIYNKGDIQKIKDCGVKLVVRLDGVPEDSRNSGHGSSRMREAIQSADYLIFQTSFIARGVGKLIEHTAESSVIHNGVDTEIFNPHGRKSMRVTPDKINIYVNHYRKDPNKRYEEVVEMFRMLSVYHPDKYRLVLVGRYPTSWQEYNFGFFNKEDVCYLGVRSPEETAEVLRACDVMFHPSFADPSPNSVLEALACGVPVVTNPYSGARELINLACRGISGVDLYTPIHPEDWKSLLDNTIQKVHPDWLLVNKFFALETMVENYYSIFKSLI